MPVSKSVRRLLWFAVVFLVVIGIAAVTRRSLALLWPQHFAGKLVSVLVSMPDSPAMRP
jgi:hypothetical protein